MLGAPVVTLMAIIIRAHSMLAAFPTTVIVAADVARCESSARLDDGAVVLQVALNRARAWRRPLLDVMTQPWQFARGCPVWPRMPSVGHLRLGVAAALGTLRVPAWARGAFEYLGPSDRGGLASTRGPVVGRIVHTFHGPRPR